MGLRDKLEGKRNIQLRILKKQEDGILEFYLEARYQNGEEHTTKELVYGPIVVNERGCPIVPPKKNSYFVEEEEVEFIKNLMPQEQSSIDVTLVPSLLRNLMNRLSKLKSEGIKIDMVGSYTLGEIEKLYS